MKKLNLKGAAAKWFKSKDFRLGGYSAASGVLVAAIGIAAVLIAESLPTSFTQLDMSGRNLFDISQETKNIVDGLDKEVDIYLIASDAQKNNIIDRMLQKYDSLSGNINYSVQDPVSNPSFAKKYTDEDVTMNSVIVVSGDKSKYISYNDIFKTNIDYETYSQSTEFDGENSVTSAISYVSSDDMPKLYTLTGHGETELDSNFTDMITDRNMETEALSLLTKSEIPQDADAILINEPQSDLSEQEVTLLKAYADKGGDIIVVSGYTGEDMTNLNKLAEYYGLALEKDMIMEGDATRCIRGYNYYIIPDISSHEITDPLNEENYFVITPMTVNIKSLDNGKGNVTEILKTSGSAYVKTDTANMTTAEKTDADVQGTYTVGAVSTIGSGDAESKLLMVSAEQFLDSQMDQLVSGGNGDLFLNALSWMTGREEGIAIHAKSLDNEYITIPDGTAGILGFIVIFVVPAAVIAVGIYVLIKRRRR